VTLELRLLDESDAEAIVSGQCPEGFAAASDYPAQEDRVAAGLFLERLAAGVDPRPYGAFAVCVVPGDEASKADPSVAELLVGGIGFHGPPDEQGRVEIGYGIVPSQRRKGLATQALRLLVEHAQGLGASTLSAETEVDNEGSQGVLTKVGFARFAEDERTAWFELALGSQ
jgi:RimJ/RimL family protein N-acetyltransferase